jgi:septal ring factor EnvC (AmiA/AmiB activator)
MDIPSVPTDNLYKFMALSGLAIVITCLYLFFSRADQLNERLYDVAERKSILEANIDAMNDEISKLNRSIAELKKAADSRDVLAQLTSRVEEGEKIKSELLHTRKELIDLTAAAEVADMIRSLQTKQAIAFMLFETIGIVISGFGFMLWYTRVQKFLDVQLAKTSSANVPP